MSSRLSAGADCSNCTGHRPWNSRTPWRASPRSTARCAGPRSMNQIHRTSPAADSGCRSERCRSCCASITRRPSSRSKHRKKVDRVVRLLLLLLGTLTAGRPGRREAAWYQADNPDGRGRDLGGPARPGSDLPGSTATWPGPPGPPPPWRETGGAGPGNRAGGGGGPRHRRVSPRVKWAVALVVAGWIFRKAIASVVLMALSAALHLVGLNVHLPSVKVAWPWQTITAGTTSNTDLGPWVLQKIEGISKPALGVANFNFLFTHKVSKSIGPWPCWYASTFYAVAHVSATVDLNPGPAWWTPATGHYRLQVLSRPQDGKP